MLPMSYYKRPMRALVLLSLLVILVVPAAAQSQSPQEAQAAKPKTPEEKKEEVVAPAPVDPKSYIIGPEDVLLIHIWRENEMSGNVVVRPDGKVSLVLAGEVDAAGLTPEQLTVKVTEAYSKLLTKPEVSISVMSVRSKRYYVSGNVGKPGPVPLVTPTTVLQALSSCGLGQWARKNKIVIMRGNERIKFNYDEVVKGKNLGQNIFLQSGDHIYVP